MRVHHSARSMLCAAALMSSTTFARLTPDECGWDHMPTASESEACKLAEKHLTETAKASISYLEPLIGKQLLIPATEPHKYPPLDWRALMPSLQYWTGLAPAKRENLTLDDFPEDLEWRHCCYPPSEERSCIFTADYVTWR